MVRIQGLKKAEHGGLGSTGEFATTDRYLDFSASLNPVPPFLNWNISQESIVRYPDDSYAELKAIIARHHHRKPEEICVGNGSVEVIRTLCHTILGPGTTTYIPPHTFSEYALSARLAGSEITHDPRARADLSFVCNPDNPSGNLLMREKVLTTFHDRTGITRGSSLSHEGILCIDEAFIDLADPDQSVSTYAHPNLVILRSLTKSFSMAGVRFGYCIGEPALIEAMETMRPPWAVNAFAEAMAREAFSRYDQLECSRAYIKRERERISARCSELGLGPSPAHANYILIKTACSARELTENMKKQGILVRDCTSFGLPDHIRVAVRTADENDKLLQAFERCLR